MAGLLAMIVAHPIGAGAAAVTVRASVDTSGGDANGPSYDPYISDDGRYALFTSRASDLVAGDTNGTLDVFRRDMTTGTTVRVSVDMSGGNANAASDYPNITGDGRYVDFRSLASDLVPGDNNGTYDVFRRDMTTGSTIRASVDMNGGDPNNRSQDPYLSPDGRWITFWSLASDLVPGDANGVYDVYVRDLVAGTNIRASVDINGGDPNGQSRLPSISADGRYVCFESSASDLVPGDTNGAADIFVRDLVAGTTTRVSVDMNGGDPNGPSIDPNMTSDARWVAYYSLASDILPGDGNGLYDIYLRDMTNGTTARVTFDMNGGDPNGNSIAPDVTPDGRYVAFDSTASDLVAGDANARIDAYVRDMTTGTTTRVSVDTNGGDSNGATDDPAITSDGRFVAIGSFASDLVTGDGNATLDVFVRQLF